MILQPYQMAKSTAPIVDQRLAYVPYGLWHLARVPFATRLRRNPSMAKADPSPHRLERRLALVRKHVNCENRRDFEGILQTFGAAIAYEDQAWRTPRQLF
jgi:hypothetical protein